MVLFILNQIAIIIAAFVVLKPLLAIIVSLFHHFRAPDNLLHRYGKGTWAIVTGATDGIGFGFCQELAAQGFNICLVSRNPQKLAEKADELKKTVNEKVEYKCITADFTKSYEQGFYEPLQKCIQELEIAILVNNVGISCLQFIDKQSQKSIKDIVNVNCSPMAVLTSLVSKKMNNRSHPQTFRKNGAIINISSYSCVNPMPYMSVYAATKGFNDIFSRSCAKQQTKIDILSVRAMKVISGRVKQKPNLTICTSRQCAHDSLKYLGHQRVIAGHIKHQILSHITSAIPEWVFDMIAIKEAWKAYQDYGKEQ